MQFVCFREGQFQVVRNILGGKYASSEMLLQVLNFWRSSTKCNTQKAFCEIIGSYQFLLISCEKFQLLQLIFRYRVILPSELICFSEGAISGCMQYS